MRPTGKSKGNTMISKTMTLAAAALAGVMAAGASRAADDIVDTAVAAGTFNTLAAALTEAGLVATLKGPGPFTVFAPTDAAFAKLPSGTVETLLKPENKAKLTEILTYHVVPGKLMAADVAKYNAAKTAEGAELPIEASAKGVKVGNANITAADIIATNGVIHVIDAVLLPPES